MGLRVENADPDQKLLKECVWPGSWVGHQDVVFEQCEGVLSAALPEQAGGSQPPGQTWATQREKSWERCLWWTQNKGKFQWQNGSTSGGHESSGNTARSCSCWAAGHDIKSWSPDSALLRSNQHQLWAAASQWKRLEERWKLSWIPKCGLEERGKWGVRKSPYFHETAFPGLQMCVTAPFNRISSFTLHHRRTKLLWKTPGLA